MSTRRCLAMGSRVVLGLALLTAVPARAQEDFSKVADGEPELVQEGPARGWCPGCGMSLKLFYKTSHALVRQEGEKRHFCSLHCLATHLAQEGERPGDRILAVDAASGKLCDARAARYVVGSEVPGTMSRVSKLAFTAPEAAAAFAKRHGGQVGDFAAALKAARDSLAEDDAMVQAKKRQSSLPAGAKIHASSCRAGAVDPNAAATVAELKASLVEAKACSGLDEPKLQLVALHLWASRAGAPAAAAKRATLTVGKDDRCAVCGMFVSRHAQWLAQVEYADGKKLSFDGPRDFFKFLQSPARWGGAALTGKEKLSVTDYYDLGAVDARSASYVVGSDVLGPMGHELVAFRDRKQAESFKADHKGKQVLAFEAVAPALIAELEKAR